MNIQVLSDMHLEFHPDDGDYFLDSLDPRDVDVLVVAGDLCLPRLLPMALRSLCARYAEVIYVIGNHEYYYSSPGELHAELRSLGDALPNLHWLRNDGVKISGVRFAGTTLWFRDHEQNAIYEHALSDFQLIRGFKPWVYEENERSLAFLEAEAAQADVIVTHHLPSRQSIAPCFEADPLNRFFLCELDDLIHRAQPPLWIHGHTHASIDARVGETRVVCNPHGYMPGWNWDFHPKLVLRAEPGDHRAAPARNRRPA